VIPNLTEKIYQLVVLYKAANDGNPPSMEYLAQGVGVAKSTVLRHLRRLEEQGRIELRPGRQYIRIAGGRWIGPEGEDE